jgi:hypothetical protein
MKKTRSRKSRGTVPLKFQAVSLLLLCGCRSQQQREPERQITVVHTGEAGNIDRTRGAEQQHHASFSFVQMPGVLLFTDHSTTTQLPFTREQEGEGEGRGLEPSATTTLSPAGRRRQARYAGGNTECLLNFELNVQKHKIL